MERYTGEVVVELMELHQELWAVVDGMHSQNDQEAITAARQNNRLVKTRSRLLEEIDEIIINQISQLPAQPGPQNRAAVGQAAALDRLIEKACHNRVRAVCNKNKQNGPPLGPGEAKEISRKLEACNKQGRELAEAIRQLLDGLITGHRA